jgi:hypothetical protein
MKEREQRMSCDFHQLHCQPFDKVDNRVGTGRKRHSQVLLVNEIGKYLSVIEQQLSKI